MNLKTVIEKCYILQEENAIDKLERQHFDPSYWHDKPGFSYIDGGRGGSVKIDINGQPAILRSYLRGGMVARWVADKYMWLGKNRTRPWREWSILKQALEAGMPVPTPIGVCSLRNGLSYRGAIITAYLENTDTLAARLSRSSLDREAWYQLGLLLKRFQACRFRHADLNANNILINQQGQFFIIDFDKARIMKCLDEWQWKPLFRLQRSLEKLDRQQGLQFRQDDWQALMDGYQSSTS